MSDLDLKSYYKLLEAITLNWESISQNDGLMSLMKRGNLCNILRADPLEKESQLQAEALAFVLFFIANAF